MVSICLSNTEMALGWVAPSAAPSHPVSAFRSLDFLFLNPAMMNFPVGTTQRLEEPS